MCNSLTGNYWKIVIDRKGKIKNELVKGQLHFGTDNDVGRIPYQGGRSADIGNHGLTDDVNLVFEAHAIKAL